MLHILRQTRRNASIILYCTFPSGNATIARGGRETEGVNGPILADTRSEMTVKRKGKRD